MSWPLRTHLALPLLCAAAASTIVLAAAGSASGGTPPASPVGKRSAPHPHSCKPSRAHRRVRRSRCHHVRTRPKARAKPPVTAGPPAAGGIDGMPPLSSPVFPGSAGAAQAPPEAASPEPAPPSVPHVQVIAVEYGLTLSRSSVPAGKVVLELVNRGQDEHNLNAAALEGPLTASVANTAAGAVVDETVEMSAGSYTLFCSLPEHEQKGMKATLVVH